MPANVRLERKGLQSNLIDDCVAELISIVKSFIVQALDVEIV
jgi:hypothetical protein